MQKKHERMDRICRYLEYIDEQEEELLCTREKSRSSRVLSQCSANSNIGSQSYEVSVLKAKVITYNLIYVCTSGCAQTLHHPSEYGPENRYDYTKIHRRCFDFYHTGYTHYIHNL
jgi:hypothetical protein